MHILKSIVKKLEEKNQKFKFVSSHAICRAAPPGFVYPICVSILKPTTIVVS